ncbi:type II secretion system inner membrane protein GspF [Pigmentiphaga soli]|uniref:Type II secretion system inner membrane protein GspF n=1 Tax=Pigmentiphaga soli TaxID=1007095 RepID=A0ABP8HT72_9BURK
MPSYRFEAADAAGKLDRGLVDADSPRAARAQLRGRGLTPLSVEEVDGRSGKAGGGRGWFGARMSDAELAWATRQLASLLEARLPIDAALTATAEQAERKHTAEVMTAVRADVRAGHRLADALAARPRDFPDIYRALVAAGEESGDLAQVMDKLAGYIEERNALRTKVLTAFIYPAVVTVVSIGIVIFLLGYVVPQVVSAFSQARQELPLLTRVMLQLSEFVRSWGWLVALLAAAAMAGWRMMLRNAATRLAWHARVLRLPLAGRFVLGLDAARFASTLAILTGSGVPLLRSLDAARQTLGNDRLRAAIDDATARVREGVGLAPALQAQKLFPPLLVHLTASGEKTGTLPELLDRAAQTLSREVERRAMALTALLEPLMILVMGGVVLLIVLAVLMPIIEINQLVR